MFTGELLKRLSRPTLLCLHVLRQALSHDAAKIAVKRQSCPMLFASIYNLVILHLYSLDAKHSS